MMEKIKEDYVKKAKKMGWNVLTNGFPDVVEWREKDGVLEARFVELKNKGEGLRKNQVEFLSLLELLTKKMYFDNPFLKVEVGISRGRRKLINVPRFLQYYQNKKGWERPKETQYVTKWIDRAGRWKPITFKKEGKLYTGGYPKRNRIEVVEKENKLNGFEEIELKKTLNGD